MAEERANNLFEIQLNGMKVFQQICQACMAEPGHKQVTSDIVPLGPTRLHVKD